MPEDNEKPRVSYDKLPGNSKKEREEGAKKPAEQDEKIVKKVTTAKVRKQSLGRRMAETFTGDDAQSVGQYVLFEVLLPAFKNMVADAVTGGVERLMFGDSRGRRGSSSSYSKASYTPYNRMSSSSSDRDRERRTSTRVRHGHEEIIVDNRDDANDIISQLIDLIERFDVATVPDLYAMIDKTPNFTDEKYGWTDIHDMRRVEVRRLRDGWLIDLPRPEYLD